MRTAENSTTTIAQNIIPGLLATFVVWCAAMERTLATTKGITNAHVLFFSSFLDGLSQAYTDDDITASLDSSTLADAETTIIQHSSISTLEQIRKDFTETYNIQKEKFDKAAAALQKNSNRSQDFLILPKKEFLALDRSARAFLLRESLRSQKMLNIIDTAGHYYSAAVSVSLLNLNRLGATIGMFIGTKLNQTRQLKPTFQVYFLAHLLNKEVLNSPLGKTLGLNYLSKKLSPVLNCITNLIPAQTIIKRTTAPLRQMTRPLRQLTTPIKSTFKYGSNFLSNSAKFVINSILAAKTYVLAPTLAGIFDGLTESITLDNTQIIAQGAAEITPEDQRTFLTSIWQDFHIAYGTALKKFQKYDKFLVENTPMESILKKNPTKAEKAEILAGREAMLKGGEKSKMLLHYSDTARATAQAGASVVASKVYQVGKWAGRILSNLTTKKEQTK